MNNQLTFKMYYVLTYFFGEKNLVKSHRLYLGMTVPQFSARCFESAIVGNFEVGNRKSTWNAMRTKHKSRVRFRVRSCTNYTVGRNRVKGYSLHRVFIKYRSFLVVKSPKNANKVWLMAKTETIQYKFWIFLSQTVIKANLKVS